MNHTDVILAGVDALLDRAAGDTAELDTLHHVARAFGDLTGLELTAPQCYLLVTLYDEAAGMAAERADAPASIPPDPAPVPVCERCGGTGKVLFGGKPITCHRCLGLGLSSRTCCPECGGGGQLHTEHLSIPCTACHGTGEIHR